MGDFLEVLRFELRLQGRSPMLAGLMAVFFAIHLLTMAQIGIHISDNQLIAYETGLETSRRTLIV